MSTAGKIPLMCARNLKIPLNMASDSSSLTVLKEARFLDIVSIEREVILSPDASMTPVFEIGKSEKMGNTRGLPGFVEVPS